MSVNPRMEIKWQPIGSVKPYHNNPRRNDAAVEKVRASIEAYGWQQPIVVDKKGVIVVGHTRYKAAEAMGLKQVPVLVAAKLTVAKAKAYRLADNRTGEAAEWDDDLLGLELAELAELDVDLALTGFDPSELDLHLEASEPSRPRNGGEESVSAPENPYGGATAISRGSAPIKLWRKHKLLQGEVLDFGAGHDTHQFAKYDPFHHDDPSLLTRTWDTVMCNYVLNVQPADHLVVQICALLGLLAPEGRILIACRADVDAGVQVTPRGIQRGMSGAEWEALIGQVLTHERLESPATFYAWSCAR